MTKKKTPQTIEECNAKLERTQKKIRQYENRSKIADFNLHDTGGGNPHAHILLTMRPLDEKLTK